MAIDRDLITKQIFNGTVTPADGWVSPVVDGFKAGACGESCTFNPAEAKELYDAAGGYKGTLTMPKRRRAEQGLVGGGLQLDQEHPRHRLHTRCPPSTSRPSASRSTRRRSRASSGSAWQMDYPSIENFLAPLYAKGASSNEVEVQPTRSSTPS